MSGHCRLITLLQNSLFLDSMKHGQSKGAKMQCFYTKIVKTCSLVYLLLKYAKTVRKHSAFNLEVKEFFTLLHKGKIKVKDSLGLGGYRY